MNEVNKVTVRVPATSANLGGGFDCMGLALELYNEITVERSDRLTIVSDVNAPTDENNLIYKSVRAVFDRCGREIFPVHISTKSGIPLASGLGSSATCIVGGVVAANRLLGEPLDKSDVIDLCTSLDGHPDNVLPAIVGGVTAGYMDENGRVGYVRTDCPDGLTVVVATPEFGIDTQTARAKLPNQYSREDCVYSLSRAVVTFGAFCKGDINGLKAIDDRLHQPYRIPMIGGYEGVRKSLINAGAVAVCVSGAGPSVLGLFDGKPTKGIAVGKDWTVRKLNIDNIGCRAE